MAYCRMKLFAPVTKMSISFSMARVFMHVHKENIMKLYNKVSYLIPTSSQWGRLTIALPVQGLTGICWIQKSDHSTRNPKTCQTRQATFKTEISMTNIQKLESSRRVGHSLKQISTLQITLRDSLSFAQFLWKSQTDHVGPKEDKHQFDQRLFSLYFWLSSQFIQHLPQDNFSCQKTA